MKYISILDKRLSKGVEVTDRKSETDRRKDRVFGMETNWNEKKKTFPIGTIRKWKSGYFIKASANKLYGSSWLPVVMNNKIYSKLDSIADIGKKVVREEKPVDGEIYMDLLINDFTYMGKKNMNAWDFKRYIPHPLIRGRDVFLGYSFPGYFVKRWHSAKMRLHRQLDQLLIDRNMEAFEEIRNENPNAGFRPNERYLTKKDVNEIKKEFDLKGRLEEIDSDPSLELIDEKELDEFIVAVKKGWEDINRAKALPTKEKETHDKIYDDMSSLWEKKRNISDALKYKNDLTARMEKHFGDNLAIMLTFRDNIRIAWKKYINTYGRDVIKDDYDKVLEDVDVYGEDIDKFYGELRKKIEEKVKDLKPIGYEFPDDLIGKRTTIKQSIYGTRRGGIDKYHGKQYVDATIHRDKENGFVYYECGTVGDWLDKKVYLEAKKAYDENDKEKLEKYHVNDKFGIQGAKEIINSYEGLMNGNEVMNKLLTSKNKEDWLKRDWDENRYFHKKGKVYRILGSSEVSDTIDSLGLRGVNMSIIDESVFEPFMNCRFVELYGKALTGGFIHTELDILEQIEKAMRELPNGHAINNDNLKGFEKDLSYNRGPAFALYNSGNSKISFSKECISQASSILERNNGNDIKDVIKHEIGHAFDEKLMYNKKTKGLKNAFDDFFGWIKGGKKTNLSARENDYDLEKDNIVLTNYAKTQPAEAFAEYYSIYANNKRAIDKYLDTGDKSYLAVEKYTEVRPRVKRTFDEISSVYYKGKEEEIQRIEEDIHRVLKDRDLGKYITVKAVDPSTIGKIEKINTKRGEYDSLKYTNTFLKQSVYNSGIAIQSNGDNGKKYIHSSPMINSSLNLKRILPVIEMDRKLSYAMEKVNFGRNVGVNKVSLLLKYVGDRKVGVGPVVKKVERSGMKYDKLFISDKKIVKNRQVLGTMRRMYEHKEMIKSILDSLINYKKHKNLENLMN